MIESILWFSLAAALFIGMMTVSYVYGDEAVKSNVIKTSSGALALVLFIVFFVIYFAIKGSS